MSDDASPVICPECGFPAGDRHECARRMDTGSLLHSTTDVTTGDVTAPITLTLNNVAGEQAMERIRERIRRRREGR